MTPIHFPLLPSEETKDKKDSSIFYLLGDIMKTI